MSRRQFFQSCIDSFPSSIQLNHSLLTLTSNACIKFTSELDSVLTNRLIILNLMCVVQFSYLTTASLFLLVFGFKGHDYHLIRMIKDDSSGTFFFLETTFQSRSLILNVDLSAFVTVPSAVNRTVSHKSISTPNG